MKTLIKARKKRGSLYKSLISRAEAFALPTLSETSNTEAHADMNPYQNNTTQFPHERNCIAALDVHHILMGIYCCFTCDRVEVCEVSTRQSQASSKRLSQMSDLVLFHKQL